MIEDSIVRNLIQSAEDDYFGLWVIPWEFETFTQLKSASEIKEKSLNVVKNLIANNILPGWLADAGGFDFWQGTPGELYQRVASSWIANETPTLGSNHCWFALRK